MYHLHYFASGKISLTNKPPSWVAGSSTTFDLLLMVGLGVFGYLLRKMHFPMSPLILGFVLGEMLEQNLRRALSISNGDTAILWSSSISQTLLVLAIVVITLPPLVRLLRRRNPVVAATDASAEQSS